MYKLYGIKNCTSVKKTCAWLVQNAIDYQFHDYRSDGLDLAILEQFAKELGWRKMLNCRSSSWRQLSEFDKTDVDKTKALQLMLQHPTLIKRPIFVGPNKMLIGFSASAYQNICSSVA